MSDSLKQKQLEHHTSADEWLLEKSDKVLKSFAELVDFVFEQDNLTENDRNHILAIASSGLLNITRIMSSAGYVQWSVDDRDIILKNGYGGYKAISAKYKNMDIGYVVSLEDFWEKLEIYLRELRPNRTSIHELLRLCVIKDRKIDLVRDLTESLVMGEMDWEMYVVMVKDIKSEAI